MQSTVYTFNVIIPVFRCIPIIPGKTFVFGETEFRIISSQKFTYAIKGRVELLAAIWMLVGAAVGAQLGTVAVKYVRGYSIRLLFAVTIFIACISVVLKQLQLQMASSIAILAAALAISGVIISWLIKGILGEKAAARSAVSAP